MNAGLVSKDRSKLIERGIAERPKQTLSKRLKQALDVETSKPLVKGQQIARYQGIRLENEEGLLGRSESVIW